MGHKTLDEVKTPPPYIAPAPPIPIPRQPIHPPANITRTSAVVCKQCSIPMKIQRLKDVAFIKKPLCSVHIAPICANRHCIIKSSITFVAMCAQCSTHTQPKIVCVDCIEYLQRFASLPSDPFYINHNYWR